MKERPNINISFQNLSYSVPVAGKKEKKILNNINGYFKSSNITAIIGPSGGGKSTLLNILSGYITLNISGTIYINEKKRDLNKFYKLSGYIMQDTFLTSYLTVYESMNFASRFKLGNKISIEESHNIITKALEDLHLTNCQDSLTNNLSSGEKKRLVIAMELLDCPAVIFLDEPTTGLDEHSSYECISFLKNLANEGITVVTSIHTPSPKVLQQFDHIYALAEGQCIYQGIGTKIVPFLKQIQLNCPLHYNPTDFLIEVSSGEYGEYIDKLVELAKNDGVQKKSSNNYEYLINKNYYNCSFSSQFYTLLHRSFLRSKRNIRTFVLRMVALVFIIAILSIFYYKCGNDGSMIKTNPFFLMLSILYLAYATMIPTLSNTPMEVKIIRSEFFNKWFNVLPYFFAVSVEVLPFMIMSCGLYVIVLYPITDQPPDIIRMCQFFSICLLVTMVTDAFCQIVGIIFDPVNSLFLGVCIFQPIGIFAIQSFGHNIEQFPLLYQYLIKTSYMRFALEGLVHTVYNNRENIYCPEDEIFCPLSTGEQVIKQFGYGGSNFLFSLLSLIFFYIFFKIIAFYMLTVCIKPQKATNKLFMLSNYLQIKYNNN